MKVITLLLALKIYSFYQISVRAKFNKKTNFIYSAGFLDNITAKLDLSPLTVFFSFKSQRSQQKN